MNVRIFAICGKALGQTLALLLLAGMPMSGLLAAAKHPMDAALDSYPDAVARRRAGLWQAIGRLPLEQRVALALRYEFELPLALAARVMRSSPGGVHARLSAARQTLGDALDALQAAPTPPAAGGQP